MESVKRYSVAGKSAMYETTDGEWVVAMDFDRVTAEREALQLLLNDRDEQLTSLEQRRYAEQQAREAAERRVEALSEALKNMIAAFDTPIRRRKLQSDFNEEAIASAYAALNPTAEAESNE